MNADYTYDQKTDQFVVTLDDGTEVCRTRAPHRAVHQTSVAYIASALNRGEVLWDKDQGTLTLRRFADMLERMTFSTIEGMIQSGDLNVCITAAATA